MSLCTGATQSSNIAERMIFERIMRNEFFIMKLWLLPDIDGWITEWIVCLDRTWEKLESFKSNRKYNESYKHNLTTGIYG